MRGTIRPVGEMRCSDGDHKMNKKRKYFGTDGIRGYANKSPMTVETAMKVGQFFSNISKEVRKRFKNQILIKLIVAASLAFMDLHSLKVEGRGRKIV